MNGKSIWGDKEVRFTELHSGQVSVYEMRQTEIEQLKAEIEQLKAKRQTKNIVASIKVAEDRLNCVIKNTITPINSEEFIKAVLSKIDAKIDKLNEKLDELKGKFAVNPINFLEWDFENVVKVQQTLVRYNQIRRFLINNKLPTWESKHLHFIEKIRDEVMGDAIDPSSSTNSGSNLVARYKLSADAKFISPHNWDGEALKNIIILTLIEMSETKQVVFLI